MNKSIFFSRVKLALIYLCIILVIYFYLYPIFWELSTSLKEPSEVFSGYNLIPKKISLESYILAWTRFNINIYLVNTILVSGFITLGTILSCSLSGFAFSQLKFPGRNFLFFLYLSTMMIPASITLIPTYFIILKLNWMDTYMALIVPFAFGNAFGTFLLRQFYMMLPKELMESAKMDGASYWEIWRHIMFPLSFPAIATLSAMTLVSQWNSFIWPLVVTHSKDIKVLSVGLSDFRLLRSIQWNSLMATVMLASILMIVILLLAQKYFIKGIQFSGINR